jgi:hypothetical protein
MDLRGLGREAGELYSELYIWSSLPESPGSCDDADSSRIPGESSEAMCE